MSSDASQDSSNRAGARTSAGHSRSAIDVRPDALSARPQVHLSDFAEQGWYARDEDRNFSDSTGSSKVFNPSNELHTYNLLTDFEKVEKFESQSTAPRYSLVRFLDSLSLKRELLVDQPTFICSASTPKNLMLAPYEIELKYPTKWKIWARKVYGIWFMSERWETHDSVRLDAKYAGYVFELLMTNGEKFDECAKNAHLTFSKHQSEYRIVTATIGDNRLLYAGEIDCHDADGLIELKTTKAYSDDTCDIMQYVLRRSWAQAYLMGVRKIIFGLRRENTIVQTVDLETDSLPVSASGWSSWVCTASLKAVLDFLRTSEFASEDRVYELELSRNKKEITVCMLDEHANDSFPPEQANEIKRIIRSPQPNE